MNKIFLTLLVFFALCHESKSQIQLNTSDFTGLIQNKSFSNIGVHDPSIFFDDKSSMYYIFGTHYSGAKTNDLRNWTRVANYYNTSAGYAFNQSPTRIVNRCLSGSLEQTEVSIPSYNAKEFCSTYGDINSWINGNMWAPDIIYNPHMNKYCLYLSLNGDNWASVIVLMTADKVEGPYTYQGPIIFGGFNGQSYGGRSVNYKKTDLEVVLGSLSKIPSRYVTDRWGSYYPNCIDPCVLFDDEGELWMSYGSWSGGIFLLKLDKNTGFRDYTYTYTGTGSSPDANASSDAYFGKKIAGGYYVSGEGSYIQKIGKYYFLFMTYGGLESNKGYEMRVFRSDKITGPYKDAGNQSAVYTAGYQLNYGPNANTNRGMKLIGSMNYWGQMKVTECAQGHNSATVDKNGRNFLFFHTRFDNGNEGFQVRSYQMYLNKSGWLCTAPFQFYGETTTDADIESSQPYSFEDVVGDYHVLIHPYKLDHLNYEASLPKLITLGKDGKVTGDYTGTWKYTDEGKSYISITLKNVNKVSSTTFEGVVVEQTMENTTIKTLCFTTVCSTAGNANVGVPLWGYKMQPSYAIAYNYQNNTDYFKLTNYSSISKNLDFMFKTTENVQLSWTSSEPDVVSNEGKYNPKDENVSLNLTARLECGNYYWEKVFTSSAKAATEIVGDQRTGLVAYYNFDEKPTYNLYNEEERIVYGRSNTTSGIVPTLEVDWARFGSVVHQYFGAQGMNSYSRVPNPLLGKELDGFTVSLWVKRSDDNKYDALWSFFNGTISSAKGPRFFLTGNAYAAFNDDNGNWFDINNPEKKATTLIKQGEWHLVTVSVSKTNGLTLYIDGTAKIKKGSTLNCTYEGSATKDAFDYSLIMDFVSGCKYFYLGLGSFGGSADAYFDDLMIYDRELSADDVKGLSTILNRVNDMRPETSDISDVIDENLNASRSGVYDIYGRKIVAPSRGIYIVNGKKVLIK